MSSDEHQGGPRVGERKASELLRIQSAPIVATNNSADHNQDAASLRLLNQASQRVRPSSEAHPLSQVDPKGVAHPGGCLDDVIADSRRTDELKLGLLLRLCEFAVPILSLFTEIDRIDEVKAGPIHGDVRDSTEIRYGYGFDWRLGEKEVAERSVSRLGEGLELLERWLRLSTLPSLEPREVLGQPFTTVVRTLACPPQ